MKQLTQISISEYNALVERANLSEQQIEERAKELYNKNGIARLQIDFNAGQNFDHTFYIDVQGGFFYQDYRFIIPEKFRQRINKLVNRELDYIIRKKVGDVVSLKNKYVDKLESFKYWKFFYILVSITGWVSFIISMCL